MTRKLIVLIMTLLLLSSSMPAMVKKNPISEGSAIQQQMFFPAQTDNVTSKTPDWVKNAVFYQIFPDRFRDGDSSNNPVDDASSGDLLWEEWSRDRAIYAEKRQWSQLPETPGLGRDWFGGDLKGVLDKAGYLDDLGVTAVYFNPIMDSTDNHGYTIIDYKSVNRYFGALDRTANGTVTLDKDAGLQVFKDMTTTLNSYGISVILDGVFNHVSAKNQWFDRDNDYTTLGAYENQTSQWFTWFNFYDWPNRYQAWNGVLNMPELLEVNDFKNYIFGDPTNSVIKFWHDLGVDGWRLDTGQDISHTFWKEFRTAYKMLNPDGYIVGEKFGDASPWLQGDEWDSTMNYRFRDAVLEWALGGNPALLDSRLGAVLRDYPAEAVYAAFNLLGSHDTERALTHLGEDKNRMKLAVIFQMTYPGAPVIYYGDEVGMSGSTDPDCRRPYPWQDLGLTPDNDMLAHYKKLIAIRKNYSVLRTGSLTTLLTDNAKHIYALVRRDNSSNPVAVLVFNNGNAQETVTLDLTEFLPNGANLTDMLNYERYKVENGKITVQVSSLWANILLGGNVTLPSLPSMSFPYFYIVLAGAVTVIVIAATYIVFYRRKVGAKKT